MTSVNILFPPPVNTKLITLIINGQADVVDDEELIDLVDMEMRELLDSFGYDGDNTPFIVGSAK